MNFHLLFILFPFLFKQTQSSLVPSLLELGAAGALPSLMAACNDAAKVVITDYPEQVLIDMIDNNVKKNLSEETIRDRVYVKVSLFGNLL